jgi:predicted membrane protein (TIGR00267 family)
MLRDFILGGQDGLVNVLGILLGVAKATNDSRVVIIAGLAATFAESISMGAVAYTSTKAEADFYKRELARERMEIEKFPDIEREEIRAIYRKKGLRGEQLEKVVKAITSNEQTWLDTMMAEELNLSKDSGNPLKSAFIVGLSAVVGSVIPLIPFFLFGAGTAMTYSIIASAIVLFAAGIVKAKYTVGTWWKSGLEMMLIGMASALAGYFVGALLQVSPA